MIPFNKTLNKTISKEEMLDVYEKIKIPKGKKAHEKREHQNA